MNINTLSQYKLQNQNNILNNRNSNIKNKTESNNTQIVSYSKRDGIHPNAYLINFGAMKKKQFQGIERAVIETFKAPVEKFNTMDDFMSWCQSSIQKISRKIPAGRRDTVKVQRNNIFAEWRKYVTKENETYTPAIGLLILSSILAGLKENNDTLPPALNKGALADSVTEYKKELSDGKPAKELSFRSIYDKYLQARALGQIGDVVSADKFTGWVEIPSKANDEENFQDNVKRLQTLSHSNWCTKSDGAEPYLSKGDFHIYLENGKPQLGVRFNGDKVVEIQGPKNNGAVPPAYVNDLQKHIDTKRIKVEDFIKENIKESKNKQKMVQKLEQEVRAKYNKSIKELSTEELLSFLGISVKRDKEDGLLTISHFNLAKFSEKGLTLDDYGVDTNNLLEKIKEIKGDFCIEGDDSIKSFGNIKKIGGDLYVKNCGALYSLDNLEEIGGNASFLGGVLCDTGNLKKIGGNAHFERCSELSTFEYLQSIGGNAEFFDCDITSTGKLEEIRGNASFTACSALESLENIKTVGNNLIVENCRELCDTGALETVGGNAEFINCRSLQFVDNLKEVNGDLIFAECDRLKSLKKLEYIGGNADFNGCEELENPKNLKTVWGNLDISYCSGIKADNIHVGGKTIDEFGEQFEDDYYNFDDDDDYDDYDDDDDYDDFDNDIIRL